MSPRRLPSTGVPEPVTREGLRLATLPNALSVTRVLFLPPILYLLGRPDPASDRWALALLLVAGLTDLMDGFLARRRGAVSPSGKIVDPLADKILIGGLLIWLVTQRDFPAWLVGFVLLRDAALILGAWVFFRRRRVVFAADWSGKLTTFFLGLLILAYLVEARWAIPGLTVAATALLALSCVSYGRRMWAAAEPAPPAGG